MFERLVGRVQRARRGPKPVAGRSPRSAGGAHLHDLSHARASSLASQVGRSRTDAATGVWSIHGPTSRPLEAQDMLRVMLHVNFSCCHLKVQILP